MTDEERKEALTYEIVKKQLLKGSVRSLVLNVLILMLCVFYYMFLFDANKKYNPTVMNVIMGLLITFVFIKMIIALADSIKTLIITKKDLFKIVTDTQIGSDVKTHHSRYGFHRTYHLHFRAYGEFQIPSSAYKWSRFYSMDAEGVYNYSKTGDIHYLVVTDRDKVKLAYNNALFKFPEIDGKTGE